MLAHLLMRWQAVPAGQATQDQGASAHRGCPLGRAAQRAPPKPPPHCPKRVVTTAFIASSVAAALEVDRWRVDDAVTAAAEVVVPPQAPQVRRQKPPAVIQAVSHLPHVCNIGV